MSDIANQVRSIIAETFNVCGSSITDLTVAHDVDGWDSLAHTILMIRLQRHLGVHIPEEIATNARSVGELIEALRRLKSEGAS
jgi:acyl carrier protein